MTKGKTVGLGILIGLLAIFGITYALDVSANQGKVPRAVSVGGVDISGMERSDAVAKLESELGSTATRPVTITAKDQHAQLIPADAGLSLNFQAAVDSIPDASLNPISRLVSFFKPTAEHEVATDVNEASLAHALDDAASALSTDPIDGNVALKDGKVETTDPILGQTVDRGQLRQDVLDGWLDPEGVVTKTVDVEPVINKDVIKGFEDAKKAVGSDIKLKGHDNVTATLTPEQITQFTSVKRNNDHLEIVVDTDAAKGLLEEGLASTIQPGTSAKISFSGGLKSVTPHVDGITVDWDKTLNNFHDRVVGKSDRTWDAEYKPEPAKFTTEQAEAATFNDTVGEFTTSGYSVASGTNIELVAQQVNGAVVSPGETFSLNGFTGSRGAAQGYVESGIIIDGHSGKAVGGGISQFATTLYNASYFAGMSDVAHTPHSYYISRYPAGREATVYEGAIDLQFKNTTDHPVKIETEFGGGNITVRMKGTKTVEVQSINNGRWANTEPKRITLSGSDCSPSSGAPGFTTSDTRIIRDLSGNELSRETTTTVYDPQPIVSCS